MTERPNNNPQNEVGVNNENQEKHLKQEEVTRIINSFFIHIAENWNIYRNNLSNLRRTMMYYNEFAYGIRYLPENQDSDIDPEDESFWIEFNPKDPLLDGSLKTAFGDRFTEEIGILVYDAWPLRNNFRMWEGYEEPIEDTPEALFEKYPTVYPTLEDAKKGMDNYSGTGRGLVDGKSIHLCPFGTPDILYKGFITVEEFPNQKEFLDTIRKHPRISCGIMLMEKEFESMRQIRIIEDEKQNQFVEALRKLKLLDGKDQLKSDPGLLKRLNDLFLNNSTV